MGARNRDQGLELEVGATVRYQGQDLEIWLIILVQELNIDGKSKYL